MFCVSIKFGIFRVELFYFFIRVMGRGMYGFYFVLGFREMKLLFRIVVNSELRCSLRGSFRFFLSSSFSRVGCGTSLGWVAGEWGC